MTIHVDGDRAWVQGPAYGYAIRPGSEGMSPVQMIDGHIAAHVRNGTPHHPDIDALLDARLVYAIEEAVSA